MNDKIILSVNLANEYDYLNYQCDTFLKIQNPLNKQNDFSFIKEIYIQNLTENCYRDLKIEFELNTNIIQINNIYLSFLDKNEKNKITENIVIKIDAEKLYALNETLPSNITIRLIDESKNELLSEITNNFLLHPLNEAISLNKDIELLASFVTPNAKCIDEIINLATEELKEIRPNNPSFVGYQAHDIDSVRLEMKAIYNALIKANISYANPPASFYKFQRVRTPFQVLESKKGTCLDLSILYCACLEAVGLYPLLIVLNNHAFAGCFLHQSTFLENNCTDIGKIYNNSVTGNMRIELVECTMFTLSTNNSFTDSNNVARKKLEGYYDVFNAINIFNCHKSHIKPIPTFDEIKNSSLIEILKEQIDDKFVYKKTDHDGVIYNPNHLINNKFDYWSKKLLDLSLKNNLINFNFGGKTPELCVYEYEKFLREILNVDSLSVKPIEMYKKKNEFVSKEECLKYSGVTANNVIPISIDEKDYKKIVYKANSALEETGANILYLTIGLLNFIPENSNRTFHAPILLIPIKSKSRKSMNGSFEIEIDNDNIMLNTTLFEYLRVNFDLDFSSIYHIDKKIILEHDFTSVFNHIRSKTGSNCQLIVDESKYFIATFSFANQILWNDVQTRRNDLLENKIINSFVNETPFVNTPLNEIEELEKVDEVAIPLGADSSQIKAIQDAIKGESFVLDGPPGTGKSQTIVNMIVNALYNGKSVLFVAEKMAALDVVKKRISDIKLGDFCLEIHSNKSSKRHVLEQINKAIEHGRIVSPNKFDDLTNSLTNKRNELNQFVNKLKDNKYQIPLYDAILKYLSLKDFDFDHALDYKDALNIDEEMPDKIEDVINNLKAFEDQRGLYKDQLFNSFYLTKEIDLNILKEDLIELKFIIKDFENILNKVNVLINYQINETKQNIDSLITILDILINKELIFDNILSKEFLDNYDKIIPILDKGIRINDLTKDIKKYYKNEIFNKDLIYILNEIDNKELSNFKQKKAFKKSLKSLKSLQNSTKKLKIKKEEFIVLLNNAIEANKIRYDLSLNLIKPYYEDNNIFDIDFALIKYKLINSYNFINNFNKIYNKENYKKYLEGFKLFECIYKNKEKDLYKKTSNDLIEKYNALKIYEDKLLIKYEFNSNNFVFKNNPNFINLYLNQLDKMIDEPILINKVIPLNKLLKELDNYSFFTFLSRKYRDGSISLFELKQKYLLSYYKVIVNEYFKDPYYKEFNGLLFNEAIKKYNNYLDEYNALIIEETASRVTKNFPLDNVNYAKSSLIYKLQKLIKNGGLKTSIRSILKEFEDVIRTLTPVFFMSPLSAAQYLSIDNKKFDIVIFDEASQIPTCEAIGAISRGNSLIVAGDPEQMPPTNFFKASLDNNDEEEDIFSNFDDLESLLDDCLALNMKRNRLLWHYRSEHESLIKFSNNYFYNHSLYTFPSPNNSINRISFKYIPLGINVNGVNKEEAYEILKEVKRRFNDPILKNQSIGIITFNIKQQELIQDLIDDLFDTYPAFNEINENNKDKLFVKNLENVQGDERDTILFSIGFSKNKNNKLNLFFGPLSLDKGERRLNVAITRARKEMIIFSSIKSIDIDASKAKNGGAKALKNFLYYAEKGETTLIEEYNNIYRYKEGIETLLAKDLIALGYDVDVNIGDSKFKINIGIKNKLGNYILGIICDSDSYLNNNTCRDRNYVQPHILDRLNWNVIRVFSLDYLNNKDAVIEDIVNAINNPKEQDMTNTNFDEINFEKLDVRTYKRKIDYNECHLQIKYMYNLFKDNILYSNVGNNLIEIVNKEGPISKTLLFNRFKELLDITKGGSKATRIFNLHIQHYLKFNLKKETFDDFYYPNDFNELLYETYRVSYNNQRDISLVSKIEIRNALIDILEYQDKVDFKELIYLIANLFNIKNVTTLSFNKIKKLLEDVIYAYSGLFKFENNFISINRK